MRLTKIISNLKSLKNGGLKSIVVDTLKENEPELADQQTEQMSIGKDSNDEPIGFYRNPRYASFKKSRNSKAPKGVVDLKLTGSFYSGVYATVNTNEVKFDSRDSKKTELELKYGQEIFSLNNNSWNNFNRDVLFPNITPKIINFINGK